MGGSSHLVDFLGLWVHPRWMPRGVRIVLPGMSHHVPSKIEVLLRRRVRALPIGRPKQWRKKNRK